MNQIRKLEERVDRVEGMIADHRSQLKEDPENRTALLSLDSMLRHRNELQHQLQERKRARKKEVVRYRLIGEKATGGAIPLGLLGKIATQLERQIYAAAYFIRDGKRLVRRIPKDLQQIINLQLAGIDPGSTQLVVSGELTPDFFGNSLLEETLKNTFHVLRSENDDELSDRVGEVGPISAKKLAELFETIHKSNLDLEIDWSSPTGESFHWEGREEQLESFSDDLKALRARDPEDIRVEGKIGLLDSGGKFKIETEDVGVLKGDYPPKLYEDVARLRLGDRVEALIRKHVIENLTTGRSKSTYRLLAIERIEASESRQ